jgi:hypothetical protein
VKRGLRETRRLLHLSARTLAGRWYWAWPLATVLWPAQWVLWLSTGLAEDFTPANAQTSGIGIPLLVLGIAFGVQVIAGEIDRRTLEITYTVPGGTHRVWLHKLAAALLLMLAAEAILALGTWVFLTAFPLGALYGALQGAVFYMVLAMAFSALARSEAGGAILTAVVLILFAMTPLGQTRVNPFFNPENFDRLEAAELLARVVQNRIGIALAIVAITALAFARAEQRERILSG